MLLAASSSKERLESLDTAKIVMELAERIFLSRDLLIRIMLTKAGDDLVEG